MTSLFILFALILAALLAQRLFFSFAAQDPARFAATGPAFDLRTHLGGAMISEGVIFGPDGRVSVRFVARMTGTFQGETGTLAESFRYADGDTQDRIWTLKLGGGGRFTATAPDIVGTAHGQQSGATARMRYRLRLTEAAGGHVLDVTDWMYLMENGSIMNKSEMRKFGLKVAELIATIRPLTNDDA